jgi:hypothetical protein
MNKNVKKILVLAAVFAVVVVISLIIKHYSGVASTTPDGIKNVVKSAGKPDFLHNIYIMMSGCLGAGLLMFGTFSALRGQLVIAIFCFLFAGILIVFVPAIPAIIMVVSASAVHANAIGVKHTSFLSAPFPNPFYKGR